MDRLSKEEVFKICSGVRSPALLEELWLTVRKAMDDEDKRGGELNARAISVIGHCGILVALWGSIASYVVSAVPKNAVRSLVLDNSAFAVLSPIAALLVVVALGVAFVFAWRASAVSDGFRSINGRALFSSDELARGDAGADAARLTKQADPAPEDVGLALFRQYMVPHIWGIYSANFELHEAKALALGRAQCALGCGVVVVVVYVVLLVGFVVTI